VADPPGWEAELPLGSCTVAWSPAIRRVHLAFRDIPQSAHLPGAPRSSGCAKVAH